eukprot:NODE_2651_length_1126_cov_77.824825_g2529_i0.p1 GENE.NODE_2651_length_1126_cov_77.824825_g2529_i0~~NODE_2651_length_1126_cov_77.824825_g2529_i0.p1  ORF type:complete len:343 (+),score=54.04 NODE_2651_length_1126_cov_77.824825_g2529_i0:78-1106(+)
MAEHSRYLRVNPRHPISHEALQDQLGSAGLTKVPWLRSAYRLPASIKLHPTPAYQHSQVYGIDAASMACVEALDPQPGESVLDLCCAPGGKLAMIADLITPGVVTGIDISPHRLHTTRKLLQRYGVTNCRLVLGDGTKWLDGTHQEWSVRGVPLCIADPKKLKRRLHALPADAPLPLHGITLMMPDHESCRTMHLRASRSSAEGLGVHSHKAVQLYDRVLVDAECSHDGSARHVEKQAGDLFWIRDGGAHLAELYALQLALLTHGFASLRKNGILVYSTCSLSQHQNEHIVAEFLRHTPNAKLIPFPTSGIPCTPGRLDHTIVFAPATSDTSGLFIAKMQKL